MREVQEEHTVRAWGQSWAAQLRTPTVPWGGGGSPAQCPHSAQPTCLPCPHSHQDYLPTQHPAPLPERLFLRKRAVKGSWLNLLVVSAKCFNVQQIHLWQTEAKKVAVTGRCQESQVGRPCGPFSAELAWSWGVGRLMGEGRGNSDCSCMERTYFVPFCSFVYQR